MTTILRRSLLLLAAICLGLILVSLNIGLAEAGVPLAPNAPAGYIVFDRLPWDTGQQSSVRVSRTGRLYKAVYDSAGLTAYVDGSNGEYHPALQAMTKHQRGALDFSVPTGTRVIAVASGKVITNSNCQVGVRHSNNMVAYYLHMSRVDVKLNDQIVAGQKLGLSGAKCNATGPHLHFALFSGNKEVPVAFSNVPAQTSNGKTCPATIICPSKTDYVEFRYGSGGTTPPPPPPPPPPAGPTGFSLCSLENQRCNFAGVKDVAYGASGKFAFRYAVSGGIDCNNATFGDPNYGVAKACFIKDTPPFSGNVSSALSITVTQARLDVCADNLPGRPVFGTLYRGPAAGTGERLWRFTVNTPGGERCITFVDMDGAGNTLAGVTYYTVASTRPISDADAKARRTSCYSATGGYQLCDARGR